LRKEQFTLRRERDAKIRDLGGSYYSDDGRAEELKAEAKELDARIEECERRLQRTIAGARRRVRRERAAVVSTEVIEPEENPLVETPVTAEPAVSDGPTSEDGSVPELEAKTERAPEPAAPKSQTRSR
jgi:septal ring factor EnvC (AmiA/AmiB activator)